MDETIRTAAISPLRQRLIDDMNVRRFSRATQRNYIRDVGRFATFLARSPDTATVDDVRRFQIEQRDADHEQHRVSVMVLLRAHHRPARPGPQADPCGASLPVMLSRHEVTRLLNATTCLKHQAALSVACRAGLRVAEVTALKVSDIDSERMLLRVERGKGRKDRYVMLSPKLLAILRDYYRRVRPKEWLFPGDLPGQPITASAVEDVCRTVRYRADLVKPVTPHALRHAFAVHLLEAGTDLRTIQLLLGHRSLNTTAKYLRLATSKVCATASPLDVLQAADHATDEPIPAP